MKIQKKAASYLFAKGLLLLVIGLFLVNLLSSCEKHQPPLPPTKTPDLIGFHWDYVALGDSRTASADWPELFADHIEADLVDLDVSVTVHNWGSGSQTSKGLLELILENPILRNQISEADVITVWTGGYTVREMLTNHNIPCDQKAVEAFGNNLEKILSLIISLRGQNPTIIRLLEFYQPRVSILRGLGILEEKNLCLTSFNQRLHEAAEEYDIPVARIQHAFNGPAGNSDSIEAGFLSNTYIFSTVGNEKIASLLQELGYQQYMPKYSVFHYTQVFSTCRKQ